MPSQDTVELNPAGYLDVKVNGDQTYLTYDELHKDLRPLIEQLRVEKKPILGLVDFSNIGTFSASTVKAGFEILSDIAYQRVAFFGANAALKEILNGIVLAIGRADSTKTFDSKEEALAWLLS